MNRSILMLSDLAEHLAQHQLADTDIFSITPGATALELQLPGNSRALGTLVRWHDTLGAPAVAGCLIRGLAHIYLRGLLADWPVRVVLVLHDNQVTLVRTNIDITAKPTSIPVDKLRRLVNAGAAEGFMRQVMSGMTRPLSELPGADVLPVRTTASGAA